MVLLLGPDAWHESEHSDRILRTALTKLGRADKSEANWSDLLGLDPLPPAYYDWLTERFQSRVQPTSVEIVSDLPWSAVFTASIDPTLTELLSRRGRVAQPILTAAEHPPAARSRTRPPLYFLFSRAGEHDPKAQPPHDRFELAARRTAHTQPLLMRMLETATSLGVIVVEGFSRPGGWLQLEDIIATLSNASSKQVLWFGGRPDLDDEYQSIFTKLEQDSRILVYPMRLGTLVAEINATAWLADASRLSSEETNIVSLGAQTHIDIAAADRLRVESVASIVDDSWTAFLPPLGSDARYEAFRRFHGDLGGARLLVEGVRRGFAIKRDFERKLSHHVSESLTNHAKLRAPIVVEGQSGTGKSIALARIAAQLREEQTAPVLYAVGRIPQPEDVSAFCQSAEQAKAQPTVIICDANKDVDAYDELLTGLLSRGRRVVVLGSQYRTSNHDTPPGYVRNRGSASAFEI